MTATRTMSPPGLPQFVSPFSAPATHYASDEAAPCPQPRRNFDAKDEFAAQSAIDDIDLEYERIESALIDFFNEPIAQSFRGQLNSDDPAELIVGIGVGQSAEAGRSALHVYTAAEAPLDHVRSMLVRDFKAQSFRSTKLPLIVIPSGEFVAHYSKRRMRPAPNGISVGLASGETGTNGFLAVGKNSPRDNRLLLVSCNHVLANCNSASFGDPVTQPGSGDSGVTPGDDIGKLERLVTIDWVQPNVVDAATAWVVPECVDRRITWFDRGTNYSVTLSATPADVSTNARVAKAGRSTGRTSGTVEDVRFSGKVRMPNGSRAYFRDQIAVAGTGGPFSQSGDSGSIVWEDPGDIEEGQAVAPVGLLLAGSANRSLVCKIGYVLESLDVAIF